MVPAVTFCSGEDDAQVTVLLCAGDCWHEEAQICGFKVSGFS